MNIHQVNIFNIAAKTLSITKTAKKMRLSQPSVSIQIKDLEDSLNVSSSKGSTARSRSPMRVGLFPTQKPLNLIEEINAVRASSAQAMRASSFSAPRTRSASMFCQVPGRIRDVSQAEISLTILNRQEALEQCISGELDFALPQDPPKHPDLR